MDDPRELFAIEKCADVPLSSVVQVISIKQVMPDLEQWKEGSEDFFKSANDDSGTSFWYRFSFNYRFGRFEDPPAEPEVFNNEKGCACCDRIAIIRRCDYALLGPKIDESLSTFQHVEWNGMIFRPGDAVFMDPDSYVMRAPDGQTVKKEKVNVGSLELPKEYNEKKYPEKYRKTNAIKGSNQDTPDPFCIGYIVSINCVGIIRELDLNLVFVYFFLLIMSFF